MMLAEVLSSDDFLFISCTNVVDTKATGGVSGKALVRTIDGQQNATIIGMMLGVASKFSVN